MPALGLALGLALGCAKRPPECNAVIDTITQDDREIETISAKATADAKELAPVIRNAARVEDKLAGELAALSISTPDLATDVKGYEAFAHELSAAAVAMADLLDALASMRARADGLVADRDAALAKLGERCRATKSAACRRLDDATKPLDTIPDDAPYDDQAKTVDGVAAAIRDLHSDDREIDADATAYAKVLSDNAALLRDFASFSPKIAASQDALSKAIAKEQPLTDGINTLCIGHK
jgi:hypothetical protein